MAKKKMTFYEELVWRGLIQDISSPDLIDKLNEGGLTFYIGTDPTASAFGSNSCTTSDRRQRRRL